MDLGGLPLPAGCPAPGTCVRVERPEPGMAVLVLDPPHRKMPVLDLALVRDLEAVVRELEDDRQLRGVVITGRDPSTFAAGADIDAIESLSDPRAVERVCRLGQDLFHRIARLRNGAGRRVRTVAAVGGPVPGGAYELSLACDRIVLADDPHSRVGLPETQLGILPAWGGCERLPRRIGVPAALGAILAGTLFPPGAAYAKGFVDRLTPPEYLRRAALDVAAGRAPCRRRGRGLAGWLVDRNPLALWPIWLMTKRGVLRRTRGRYPAALEAAWLTAWAPVKTFAIGFEGEAKRASRLAVSPTCKHLIGIFKLMEGAKKLGRRADGSRPAAPARGVVLGAGVMGAGIASLMAERGVATRLYDISEESLDAAQLAHRAEMAKKLGRRRLRPHEHDGAIDRLDTTGALVGCGHAQIAIEAVAERLDVKRKVFAELARAVPADALLCTNTSSLSVDAISDGLPNPARFAGLHFFNPVRRMPLVEVVRGSETSDETVTRAAAFVLALGKTPVVVKDVAGFLVNRLLGPYLDEALRLYDGGVDPERIDRLAEDFGLPMGPLTLLDEVGLDIAAHAAESLHAAYGERMQPCEVIRPLIEAGALGKKSGRGFYVHARRGRSTSRTLSPALATAAPPGSSCCDTLSNDDVTDRMVLAMLNEAARALDQGVVASAAELDLATIFGMGFPPFRGGLLRWADEVGASSLVRRLDSIAASEPVRQRGPAAERFEPAPALRRLAEAGGRFHSA